MARKPSQYPFPTAGAERIKLDAHLIEGFVDIFLMDIFDNPQPTPDLHREIWEMFCSPHPNVAIAAPRGHAKSSAGTFSYGLAAALFGDEDFILLVSATEDAAAKHIGDFASTLESNEGIIETFNVQMVKNNETELVARVGGREFCIIGKGAGQKVRGLKWRQKRPGIILIDDLEEDEAVMNFERRDKLSKWFDNALLPCGNDNCRVRMVGTILHLASLLETLLGDSAWHTKRFRAHEDFDDFSNILWPEKFTEQRLRMIRQRYINKGNASGYSQEYLSHPIAEEDAYFKRGDFLPMSEADRQRKKTFYGAIDFAISKSERADNTAFTIGGLCSQSLLHIVDGHAARMDAKEIIDQWFDMDDLYKPEFWIVEAGAIEKALGPYLKSEMVRRNHYINYIPLKPTKDKQARARSIQARNRAGGVRYDRENPAVEAIVQEMLSFPRGIHDDRVDSVAWLGIGLDQMVEANTEEEDLEERMQEEEQKDILDAGRSAITGY